jgi:competence protein ComEA
VYREKYGPFKIPEDLMQVSGIGQKTFEKNQEIIIVDEPKKK